MTRDALEQNQVPIYFVAVIVAAIGGLLAPTAAQGLSALVTPAIAVLMYAMFLQIPLLNLREGLRNRFFMAALLIANFVLIPLLVWALTRFLEGQPAILIGVLLVLLTPCIDYVVVFTHIGRGDSRLILSATPIVLLLLQLALLPLYLSLMLSGSSGVVVSIGPFVEAFLALIVAPLILALLTEALVKRSAAVKVWADAWAWLPVPAMAAVLITVVGSQIAPVVNEFDRLAPVLPVYIAFAFLAPIIGAWVSRAFRLPAGAARAVTFSSSTRNSLVVLPLALALPEDLRVLAAAAVITQTLVELVAELIYVRAVPTFLCRDRSEVSESLSR
ncbi:arsenic resistance protein [Pseudomonas kuykendallii]|uniref:arsenic resistance protein n=1 Tax=Pseudomonas kuykendallii TaxID=1007099 RepID=UPI00289DD193|nr:arsenic resistance protein [Pseudomonas kuykendallii]